jgi:hypothetical protein
MLHEAKLQDVALLPSENLVKKVAHLDHQLQAKVVLSENLLKVEVQNVVVALNVLAISQEVLVIMHHKVVQSFHSKSVVTEKIPFLLQNARTMQTK